MSRQVDAEGPIEEEPDADRRIRPPEDDGARRSARASAAGRGGDQGGSRQSLGVAGGGSGLHGRRARRRRRRWRRLAGGVSRRTRPRGRSAGAAARTRSDAGCRFVGGLGSCGSGTSLARDHPRPNGGGRPAAGRRTPVSRATIPRSNSTGEEVGVVADSAEIGVFGGSGFYSLLDDVREIKVDTPYGPPSDSFFLAEVGGRTVAFLPRHGRRHTIPPHRINYRANVWAMRSLGVKAVISPCAAGSLQAPRQARRLRPLRPVRRPDVRPRGHVLRRPDRHPRQLGRHLRPGPARASRPTSSASTGSRSTRRARS